MNLPVPNTKEIEQFKELYFERTGVHLDNQEALDLATRFLILCYLGMTRPPGITEEQWQKLYARTEQNRNS
jgi:hypothetical protein